MFDSSTSSVLNQTGITTVSTAVKTEFSTGTTNPRPTEVEKESTDMSTIPSIAVTEDITTEFLSTSASVFTTREVVTNFSTAPVVVVIPEIPDVGGPCDRHNQKGCNITNIERCVLIRERAPRCVCLIGYNRGPDGKTCIAVEQYMGSLQTDQVFTDDLLDITSQVYVELQYKARQTLIKSIENSRLGSIVSNVEITGFRRSPDGKVIVDYKIDVSREYAPTGDMVQQELKSGVAKTIENGENLVNLSTSAVDTLIVSAPDPCSNPLLNHCDLTATCERSRRGFICQCPTGSTDISLNRLEAPGEICLDSPCPCRNGGQCIKYSNKISCLCTKWFIGENCTIDSRAILISIMSVLGIAFALIMLLGTYCYFRQPIAFPQLFNRYGEYGRKCFSYPRKRKPAKVVEIYQRKLVNKDRFFRHQHPRYCYYDNSINYWQRPTNELYSLRYAPTYSPGSLTWHWTEK